MTAKPKVKLASVLVALSQLVCLSFTSALAQGPLPLPAAAPHGSALPPHHGKTHSKVKPAPLTASHNKSHHYPGGVRIKQSHGTKKSKKKKSGPPPKPPQDFVGSLSIHTLAPGVVHKVHRGAMFINVLDVDLAKANVMVKPVLAGESFNKLDEVRDQAQKVAAIAAVNGNYFKRDGTPLGTLIIDGEWIAGPLFDRTCFGITRNGHILVDRVELHGTLTTSNPDVPSVWVNNINQPRRHGAHCIAYTRRWGEVVKMQYEGTLLAVDYNGRIVARDAQYLPIPNGGFVLSDSKDSAIARLNVGDSVQLSWQPTPSQWSNVTEAVSGGPVLIRDGNLYVDCKDEHFTKAWTGSQIHARTVAGVTGSRHLILATVEGPHTLWDVAKFLKKLGCVDAMNLDGGGSTTMVIDGQTVTRNSAKCERRVASALAILARSDALSSQSAQQLEKLGVKTYGTVNPAAAAGNASARPADGTIDSSGGSDPAKVQPAPDTPAQGLPPDTLGTAAQPASQYSTSANPTPVKHSHFSWMKHLNPLK